MSVVFKASGKKKPEKFSKNLLKVEIPKILCGYLLKKKKKVFQVNILYYSY